MGAALLTFVRAAFASVFMNLNACPAIRSNAVTKLVYTMIAETLETGIDKPSFAERVVKLAMNWRFMVPRPVYGMNSVRIVPPIAYANSTYTKKLAEDRISRLAWSFAMAENRISAARIPDIIHTVVEFVIMLKPPRNVLR